MGSAAPWEDFTADPRRAETAGLRASDRDRDVVLNVLGEGYAEGRLTKQEYDERSAETTAAKTLGELTPVILDLVPGRSTAGPEDLHRQAVEHWKRERSQALTGLLIPSVICWVIWIAIGWGPGGFEPMFPWPIFVTLATVANVLRVVTHKQEIVAQQQRRLEKKQLKALEDPRRRPTAE